MTEQELAIPVVEWLQSQHWDVYQEVQFFSGGPIMDIVAVRDNIMMVVEVKKSLGLAVMAQAKRSLWQSHYTAVAVPKPVYRAYSSNPEREFAKSICKSLGIGVIEVSGIRDGKFVRQEVDPKLIRTSHSQAKCHMECLHEGHKTSSTAGSANGGHWTPYRQTMDNVKRILKQHGPLTLKEIMKILKGDHHYSSEQSARGSIRKALSDWENWAEIDFQGREYIYKIKGA